MKVLKKYAELTKEKTRLNAELNKVKQEMKEIEEEVLEYFAENGIDNIKVNGLTLYPKSQVWASAKTDEELKVLIENGHADLVEEKVNTHSLSALVREMLEQTEQKTLEELPEWTEILNISEKFTIGHRSS